jgi:transcriptional regulator with XRE-family HTH domain
MVRLDTKAIDKRRLLRGWTWSDLAREVGIAELTRTKVARGRPVSIRTARRVCEKLQISLRQALVLSDSAEAGETRSATAPAEPRADEPAPDGEVAPVVAAVS